MSNGAPTWAALLVRRIDGPGAHEHEFVVREARLSVPPFPELNLVWEIESEEMEHNEVRVTDVTYDLGRGRLLVHVDRYECSYGEELAKVVAEHERDGWYRDLT